MTGVSIMTERLEFNITRVSEGVLISTTHQHIKGYIVP